MLARVHARPRGSPCRPVPDRAGPLDRFLCCHSPSGIKKSSPGHDTKSLISPKKTKNAQMEEWAGKVGCSTNSTATPRSINRRRLGGLYSDNTGQASELHRQKDISALIYRYNRKNAFWAVSERERIDMPQWLCSCTSTITDIPHP